MSFAEERPHLPHLSRSASQPKPKGILKNAPQPTGANGVGHSLQWDEENIAATEIGKDSLMKITEPKTPYVRYDAETDTIEGDIPNLDLGHSAASPMDEEIPASPTQMTVSSTGADTSGPSSRRTSFSSAGGRPGTSMSQRSGSSSRSTSFSLPNKSHSPVRPDPEALGGEVEVEEEMDEETAKKHAEFVRARGRHYSNEAEAMKRAAELMENEDDDSDSLVPPVPKLPGISAESTDDNESGTEASETNHGSALTNGLPPRGRAGK